MFCLVRQAFRGLSSHAAAATDGTVDGNSLGAWGRHQADLNQFV